MGKTFRLPPLPPKLVVQPPKVDFDSGGASADVSFACSGLQSLSETLLSLGKVYRDAAGYKMADIAHEIIEDAKDNYVPYETGALHDSGDADEYDPATSPDITEIAMWFGAPGSQIESSPGARTTLEVTVKRRMTENEGLTQTKDPSLYALEQHENMIYKHHPPPDQTGPKYLERPFNARAPRMAEEIAESVGIAFGGSGTEG